MSHPLVRVALFALLPVAAAIGGGVLAAVRPPGPCSRSAILHFAAGVVFAVVAVELLPDVVRTHDVPEVVGGFALGVAALLGVRSLTASATPDAAATAGTGGLLAAVAVDLAIDGLLLGVAFAAGAKEGRLLTLALATELLSLGLAVATALGAAGVRRGRAVSTTAALAGLFLAVAVAGASVLRRVSGHVLAVVLAFGAAALLFLVTEELLVEAHEEAETPALTATFFAGFLLFLVLGMVG